MKTGMRSWLILGMGTALLFLSACDEDCTCPEPEPEPEPLIIEHLVPSSNYLRNRFFRLDLPEYLGLPVHDFPGRGPGWRIDPASILIFKLMSSGIQQANDIANVAVYPDTTGRFWGDGVEVDNDFSDPAHTGTRWRPVEFDLMYDVHGDVRAVDLRQDLATDGVLAVTYDILDPQGFGRIRVGDRPGEDDPVDIPGVDSPHYRMKLLKDRESAVRAHTFHAMLRNIYSLQSVNIDPTGISLAIERTDGSDGPDLDETGIPYFQLFGLDRWDEDGQPGADGIPDFVDPWVLDLNQGLLIFPYEEFGYPFNAGELAHAGETGPGTLSWPGSYLADHQAPQLYDPQVPSHEYADHGHFQIHITYVIPAEFLP